MATREAVRRGLRSAAVVALSFLLASTLASGERHLLRDSSESEVTLSDYLLKVINFLWQPDKSTYEHVWLPIKFGWRIALGSFIGFFRAVFGSVGGVGGEAFLDPKSSMAISKCMITGASASTVLLQP